MFAFDLAKELGVADVDAMLAGIPLALLYEWMNYASRKPFGEERADLRAGIISAAVFKAMTGKSVRPSVFMPQFGPQHKQQSTDVAEHVFRNHARLAGHYIALKGKRG